MTLVSSSCTPSPGHDKRTYQEWSEQLTIGVPWIDGQHKHFFELAASIGREQDEDSVMSTLRRLSDYVNEHFRDEEGLMALYEYPGIDAHRKLHQQFRHKVADLLETAQELTLEEIAEEVRRLINGWLSRHIMTVDQELGTHIKTAETGETIDELAR